MNQSQSPYRNEGTDQSANYALSSQENSSFNPQSFQYKRKPNQHQQQEASFQASQQQMSDERSTHLVERIVSARLNGAQPSGEFNPNLNSFERSQWQDPNTGLLSAESIHQQMGAMSPGSTGQSAESFQNFRPHAVPSMPSLREQMPPSMSTRGDQQSKGQLSGKSQLQGQPGSQSPFNRNGKQPKQQFPNGFSPSEHMDQQQLPSNPSFHDNHFERQITSSFQDSVAVNEFQHQFGAIVRPPSITQARVESNDRAAQSHMIVNHAPLMNQQTLQTLSPQRSQQNSHQRLVGHHQKSTEETIKAADDPELPRQENQNSNSVTSEVRPFQVQQPQNSSSINARMAIEHDAHSATNSQSTLQVNTSVLRHLPNQSHTTSTVGPPAHLDPNSSLSRPAIINQGSHRLGSQNLQAVSPQANRGKQQNKLSLNLQLNDDVARIDGNTASLKQNDGQSESRQMLEASTSRKLEDEQNIATFQQQSEKQPETVVIPNQNYSQQLRVAGGANTLLALSQSQQDTYSLSQQNANQFSWRQPNQSTGEIDGLNLTDDNHHQDEGIASEINDHMQHLRQLAQQHSFRPSGHSNQFGDARSGGQHLQLGDGRNQMSSQGMGMPHLSTIAHQVEDESTMQKNSADHQQQHMPEEQVNHANSNLELEPQLSMSSSKIEHAEAQLQAEVDQIGLIYEQHKQIQNWQAQLRQQLLSGQENNQTTENDTQSNDLPSAKQSNSITIQQLAYQNLVLQQQAYQLSIGNTQQFLENMKENASNVSGQNGTPSNATKILSSIKNEPSQIQQQYQMMSPHEQDVNNLSSIDFELVRTENNNSPKKSNSDPSNLPLKSQSALGNQAFPGQTNKGSTILAASSALGGDVNQTCEPNSFSINRFNDNRHQDNSQKRGRDLRSSLSYSISQMQAQPHGQRSFVHTEKQIAVNEWKTKCDNLEQDNHILKERIFELEDQLERMQHVEQENQQLKKENSELRNVIAGQQQKLSISSNKNELATKDSFHKGSTQAFNANSSALMQNKQMNLSSQSQNQSKHHRNNSSSVDPEISLQLNSQLVQMTTAMDTLKKQKQRLEHALREESKQNEVLKIKEKILKDSLEQKMLTEQPAIKAFIKGSFARSSNITVNDSRFTQNGKVRVLSQGRTAEEERQSKSFSSEMPSAPFKGKEGRDSLLDNYLQYSVLQHENQNLKKQVDMLSTSLEKERKQNSKAQHNVSQTQLQLNHLKNQMQGNEDEFGANFNALRAQLEASQQQLALKDRDIKFFQEQLQQYGAALDQAHEELRKAMSKTQDMEQKAMINQTQQSDLEEKQQIIAELHTHVENLKNQLNDFNSVRENMQYEIADGNQRMSIFKEKVKEEASDKLNLQKQIDDLQLANGLLELAKKRLEDEVELINKRHSMEVESMKTMIDQNKNYGTAQEAKVRESIQRYQQELLEQRSHYESQNLQNLDQIAGLQQKIADLEQRLFSVQFEKAQADEDLQENQDNLHNLELEKLKCRQLLDKQRQSQTQMQGLSKRLQTFEKKHELNLQQIANLQSQNTWLKEERERTHTEMQTLKTDLKKQQNVREDVQLKLDLMEQKNHESSSQLAHEVQRLSKAKIEMEEKLEASQDQIKKLEKQLSRYKDERGQYEKDIMTFELDYHNAQRNVKALEKELLEKKEEGLLREQSDARVKRIIVENETLRSELSILKKELEYSTEKTKEVQGRLREAEEEVRQLQKSKRDFEEQLQQHDLTKESHKEENLKQLKQINQMKDEHSRLQIELRDTKNISVRQVQQIEELHNQVDHLDGVVNDQRTELTLNLRKQNDMTFRYEEGAKYWDAMQMVKDQSMEQIVRPFLVQLIQQIDVSNILQEALFGMFTAERDNIGDVQDAAENRKQVEYYERQTRELKRHVQYFEQGDDGYAKAESNHVHTFNKLFEYVKFLQDQIIAKLINSVLESRSMNILDQKRFDSNTQIMKHQSDKILELEQIMRDNEAQIMDQEKKIEQLAAEEEQSRIDQASLKQRVRDQVAEIDNLRLQLNIVQNDPNKNLGITVTTAYETGHNSKNLGQKGLLHQSRSQQSLRQLNQTQPTQHHSWRPTPSKDANLPLPPGSATLMAGHHKYSTKQQHRTEMDIVVSPVGGKSETLLGRMLTNRKSGVEGTQNQSTLLNFRSNYDSDHKLKRMGTSKPKASESALSMTMPGYFTQARSPGLPTRLTDTKQKGNTTLRAQLDNMMK